MAPNAGEAFLVLDQSLAVCACRKPPSGCSPPTSRTWSTATSPTCSMPAEAEEKNGASLSTAVAWAARGDGAVRTTVVRPANTFGIRLTARISSCGPPRAALVVLGTSRETVRRFAPCATLAASCAPAKPVNCRRMSGIRTNAAAVMLGVSPNTLRSWERRYGFPRPRRSPGGHRQYSLTEIESLRATLAETHNVSSRDLAGAPAGRGPVVWLAPGRRVRRLRRGQGQRAARGEPRRCARSSARSRRSCSRPSAAHADHGATTPEYEFGWRYATGWLSALTRLAPPATRAPRAS